MTTNTNREEIRIIKTIQTQRLQYLLHLRDCYQRNVQMEKGDSDYINWFSIIVSNLGSGSELIRAAAVQLLQTVMNDSQKWVPEVLNIWLSKMLPVLTQRLEREIHPLIQQSITEIISKMQSSLLKQLQLELTNVAFQQLMSRNRSNQQHVHKLMERMQSMYSSLSPHHLPQQSEPFHEHHKNQENIHEHGDAHSPQTRSLPTSVSHIAIDPLVSSSESYFSSGLLSQLHHENAEVEFNRKSSLNQHQHSECRTKETSWNASTCAQRKPQAQVPFPLTAKQKIQRREQLDRISQRVIT
jgi:hypothetical protein